MKNLWILALVVLVAAAAFFLGRRSGESDLPAASAAVALAPAGVAAPPPATSGKIGDGRGPDSGPQSAPVRTFRGPDGRAHIISYDEKNPPDSNDLKQVRAALLSDMKYFPRNIEQNYDLSAKDMQAMMAGTKPIPEFMLPDGKQKIMK